eukprot:2820967-Amphidinium_carterae.1
MQQMMKKAFEGKRNSQKTDALQSGSALETFLSTIGIDHSRTKKCQKFLEHLEEKQDQHLQRDSFPAEVNHLGNDS